MAKNQGAAAKGARQSAGRAGGKSGGAGKHADVLRHTHGSPRRTGHRGNAVSREQQRRREMEVSAAEIFGQAERLLEEGQLEEAAVAAEKAFAIRQRLASSSSSQSTLPVLNLLAVIHLESGNLEEGRNYFLQAVAVDEDGTAPFTKAAGGGVEKYFYLSQLSEEGGQSSVDWLEKGANILRREIARYQATPSSASTRPPQTEAYDEPTTLPSLQAKLARALCSQIEIYMTDLSFLPDSESHCERLIGEALPLSRASGTKDPTTLQTLANIRISQCRVDEARMILLESLALWGGDKDDVPHGSSPSSPTASDDEGDEDEETKRNSTVTQQKDPLTEPLHNPQAHHIDPDFPTRISLARLLMEVSLLPHALRVLERLVADDDASVEAWYLGGWCLYLLSGLQQQQQQQQQHVEYGANAGANDTDADNHNRADVAATVAGGTTSIPANLDTDVADASLEHLAEALRLSAVLDYEDERLCGHAAELVAELERALGRAAGSGVKAAEEAAAAASAAVVAGIAGVAGREGEGKGEAEDWESGSEGDGDADGDEDEEMG